MHIPSVLAAAVGALAARAALPHVLRLKLRHDVERLNAGDHRALLAGYADDAVLHFNQGAHRWSGSHGPNGEKIYANRIIIWARTRWGKIVEQRDFYEDTARIAQLEARLQDLGVLGCKTPEPLPGGK